MNLTYGLLRDKARSITAILLLLVCNGIACADDTYDPATRQLTIDTVWVGGAGYSMVVTVAGLVGGPTGTAPLAIGDSYDTASGQLTISKVTVGANSYYNVVVTVGKLVSIGPGSAADTYSGNLYIPYVQVGNNVYHDVIISVGSIVKVLGGLPMNARDVYDPGTKQLTISSVWVGGPVYTNVVITPGTLMSVGGLSPPVTLSPSVMGWGCFSPPTIQCTPLPMLVINTGTTTRNISAITLTSPSYYNHPVFTETNDCGPSLGPGQSCAASVFFTGGALNVLSSFQSRYESERGGI